ncbi:MAG: hypothetical protein ACU0C9_05875 [Paracoccaceae bacterium]
MATSSLHQDTLNQFGQNLLRILIASYFVAVSIGLISGTDATPLATMFMSAEPAQLVGASAVFILGFLVLCGIWLRPAAMLLGIILFWSSFILHFGPTGTAPLGDFWRDLVLIGALMLTYTRSSLSGMRQVAMIRWTPTARRLDSKSKITPRRVAVSRDLNVSKAGDAEETTTNHRPVDNIFLDDRTDVVAV